ncbi:LysE/ArgO family amino acid transporter [Streptomyces sp. NPDC051907]|uniref:LysE/ArgO family amino acid transporter n=1 Tax=Streptomyces sp. NPDC051907 TaxID=3155284 RepID=UPI00344646F4
MLTAVPLVQGFAVGAGLIIAIGAQNAFVIRHGLMRKHVLAVAGVSAICDITLIAIGVAGVGTAIAASSTVTAIATWGGALFLLFYGVKAFRSAAQVKSMDVEASAPVGTLRSTAIAALALSLLNPHVYLDTVVLVGSVGSHYIGFERFAFGIGAMIASATWFFSLAYGATLLAPYFKKPLAWKILDIAVGCMMWAVAAGLLVSYFNK